MTHQVSVIVHSMALKLEYPGAFTIPYTIGRANFAKALCDLGTSINLMPYSVFKTLGIGKPRPIYIRLQMADHTMKKPLHIVDDVLVHIDKFILPTDFVILDCEVDYEVPIILGRPFLAMGKALVDVEADEITFRVGDEKVVFHVCKSMRQPNSNEVCSFVDLVTEVIVDDTSTVMNVDDTLEAALLNNDDDEKEGFVECANALQGMGSYTYEPQKLSLDLENQKTPPTKPSIEKPPTLELKPSPSHLRYEFLGPCSTLPVIISSCLTNVQENSTLAVLQKKKKASLPFELIYDASDVAVGAVLGQCINKIFHPVYYASKTMNDAQVNYTVTKNELLAMENFCTYLMGTKVIVHTDHAVLRYLMSNNDCKAILMRWVLLLQEFDLEIQDRKGSENQVVDHFSCLEEEGRPHDGLEINNSFPNEQLLSISMIGMPWFANLANYLVSGIIPNEVSSNQRKKLKQDCLDYYWDEPYLFRICTDGVIRRCVPEVEHREILETSHSSPYGGHHGGARTVTNMLSYGFYWPTLYKDASDIVKRCDEFVDYVSKWIEAVALPNNEARSVVAFLK
ncbi:uncharacterized protein [Nicotiana tomentosiformis]|uniref:uncharacterized protein n=1 Tax=Nicotiana tomentosiformis TaxID=4098 RepID=UPI00388CA2F0